VKALLFTDRGKRWRRPEGFVCFAQGHGDVAGFSASAARSASRSARGVGWDAGKELQDSRAPTISVGTPDAEESRGNSDEKPSQGPASRGLSGAQRRRLRGSESASRLQSGRVVGVPTAQLTTAGIAPGRRPGPCRKEAAKRLAEADI
jgi:hypothetical protein